MTTDSKQANAPETVRKNQRSDLDFFLNLTDCRGNDVGWPEHDFVLKFYTANPANAHTASCIGGKCTNCFNDNGRIHVMIDKPRMGVGRLNVEVLSMLPNSIYPDGTQDLYEPQPLNIMLVPGKGDCGTTAEVEATLPYIKGEPFTWEDFTPEQIAELQRPATDAAERVNGFMETASGAEAQRVTDENARIEAERGRVVAENRRQSDETARIEAEKLRQKAESDRQEQEVLRVDAEKERAEEFEGWQQQLDDKADRAELSDVLSRDAEQEIEQAEPNLLVEALRKTPQALTDPERGQVLDNLGHPEFKAFDMAWETMGGTVIESGVTYEVNDATGTYADAVKAMSYYTERPRMDLDKLCFAKTLKLLPPIITPNAGKISLANAFQSTYGIKKIVFKSTLPGGKIYVGNAFATFNSSAIEEVIGELDVSEAQSLYSSFVWSSYMREIRLYHITANVDFRYAKNISLATLQYAVANAANTSAITITVHADVYAKLTDETNTEWYQVLLDAADKNITFATV